MVDHNSALNTVSRLQKPILSYFHITIRTLSPVPDIIFSKECVQTGMESHPTIHETSFEMQVHERI